VQIEIRIKFNNGSVIGTEEPIELRLIDSLNEEVIK
jgi:hypothetical protein